MSGNASPLMGSPGRVRKNMIYGEAFDQAYGIANSSVTVSPVMTRLWAPAWFGSHTRYLQRRINALADIQASHRAYPV